MTAGDLRLADLLVAISVSTDLGMGQAPQKAVRACLLATGLARGFHLSEEEVRDVYLTTLLRHLGCTATAHEEAYFFGGDELAFRPVAERTDFGNPREAVALTLATGRGSGLNRPRLLARALRLGKEGGDRIMRGVCEVASHLAERLDLGSGVRTALYQVMERWDGQGAPEGIAGEDIVLPARIAEVATQAVIFDRLGHFNLAAEMIARRSGGWIDPAVAAAFREHGAELFAEIDAGDPWAAVLDAEPHPLAMVPPSRLDRTVEVFADMVDLKSPYTLGHSSEVAGLAAAAAGLLAMGAGESETLRRAALLHDVGRTAVSNGIWDKPGPLTLAEWEQVRLHPYQTERILGRSSALAPLARLAGLHHERLDGSGYHHGATGGDIPLAAGILAAADVYQAITQDRPHRPGRPPVQAAEVLAGEAAAGRLDTDCVRAIVEAAGQTTVRIRRDWPANLSDREVEVIRLLARGLTNRQMARELVISERTAAHHVQHIYAKIGASTRASAAMFAMEHDLLRPSAEIGRSTDARHR